MRAFALTGFDGQIRKTSRTEEVAGNIPILLSRLSSFCDEDSEARRIQSALNSGGPFIPRNSGEALRLVLLFARNILVAHQHGAFSSATGNTYGDDASAQSAATLALLGELYVWTDRCRVEAERIKLPEIEFQRATFPLPSPYTTHLFQEGVRIGEDPNTLGFSMVMIAEKHDGSGVRFAIPAMKGDGSSYSCIEAKYVYGKKYFGLDDTNWLLSLPAKYLLFASSPFIPSRREKLARADRRRFMRAGIDISASAETTWLDLRTIQAVERNRSAGDEMKWRHHWVVRGHVRRVGAEKRWTYIPPHLKGDLDKPFLEHCYRVRR